MKLNGKEIGFKIAGRDVQFRRLLCKPCHDDPTRGEGHFFIVLEIGGRTFYQCKECGGKVEAEPIEVACG